MLLLKKWGEEGARGARDGGKEEGGGEGEGRYKLSESWKCDGIQSIVLHEHIMGLFDYLLELSNNFATRKSCLKQNIIFEEILYKKMKLNQIKTFCDGYPRDLV